MLNINANGKNEDFTIGMAQGTNATSNEIEKEVSMALRDFTNKLKESFGKNAIVNLATNGQLDHGGGMLNIAINVSNYPEGTEDIVDGRSTNAKGEVIGEINSKNNEGELVSQEEQDRLAKEREEALKGQVTKDEKGNQVAGLKPAVAEIK